MKSKLCIFINRSSFIGTEKALKIIKSFKKWDSDSKFKDKKRLDYQYWIALYHYTRIIIKINNNNRMKLFSMLD